MDFGVLFPGLQMSGVRCYIWLWLPSWTVVGFLLGQMSITVTLSLQVYNRLEERKNVTVKTIKKKQKHKGRGTVRTITKQVPNESFFNFFSPLKGGQGQLALCSL